MFEKVFYPKHFISEFARPSDILSTKWQERFYDDLVWEPDGGDREELVDQEQGQVHPELVRLQEGHQRWSEGSQRDQQLFLSEWHDDLR